MAGLLVLAGRDRASRAGCAGPLRHRGHAAGGGGPVSGRRPVEPWRLRRAWRDRQGVAASCPGRRAARAGRQGDGGRHRHGRWIVGGYLTFTHGSLSFLANQDSRGLEIESIAVQPLILRELGIWHGTVAYQHGSLQIVGPGVGIVATLTLGSTVLALIVLACWRRRMSWRPEVVGDAALVAMLLIATTNRVISVQYMIWLIGVAACALAFPRTSQRPVALLLLITAGLTLVEWLLLLKVVSGVGAVGAIGAGVLAGRDALLLAVAFFGFVRPWRTTCRPQHVSQDWPERTPVGAPPPRAGWTGQEQRRTGGASVARQGPGCHETPRGRRLSRPS